MTESGVWRSKTQSENEKGRERWGVEASVRSHFRISAARWNSCLPSPSTSPREIIILDPLRPQATAVAVLGDRILAVGTVEELEAAAGGQPYVVDETFAKAFQVYWDAGYQIHVHQTGDAGLDMLLDNLEVNMRRNPRYDHRTVVVHFPVSAPDQVERIKRLRAIVSGNPYYVTALADKYSEVGLGPERADQMVRMGAVERAGVSYSFHADMPMAPGQPLFLMHCGVNRITASGRVAGADQRVSRKGALKAVTLEAAYSLQLEKEAGSITPGKLANFTILDDNPVTCDPEKIKDIAVWGTIHEGRVLPVMQFAGNAQTALGPVVNERATAAVSMAHQHDDHAGHRPGRADAQYRSTGHVRCDCAERDSRLLEDRIPQRLQRRCCRGVGGPRRRNEIALSLLWA
jgi:hypothetical protein